MKTKFVKIAFVAMFGLGMGFSAYISNTKSDVALSDLALDNIEAIAQTELPAGTITCSTGGSGRCYYIAVEEGLFGA